MFTMLFLKLGGAFCSIFTTATIADWFFSGTSWAHTYFNAYPEIWRGAESETEHKKRGEAKLIRQALLVTTEFTVAFIAAYLLLSPGILFGSWFVRSIVITLGFWCVVALPFASMQHLFVKYHRMSTVLLLSSWFVKLFAASIIMSALF